MGTSFESKWDLTWLSSPLPRRRGISNPYMQLLLFNLYIFAIQVSGKTFVQKDGPFVVNVSVEQTMVVVNKLITGLTYTFSVRYQLILT